MKSSLRPNQFRFFLCMVFLVSTQGCGPRELPFTDNSKDSTAFALTIKETVLNTMSTIKGSREPADSLGNIATALSALDLCPTGEHLKTYKELFSLTNALMIECEKGKPAGFDAKIKAIADLANTLPGDVKLAKSGSD